MCVEQQTFHLYPAHCSLGKKEEEENTEVKKENKAGYTAKPVACCWAGAVMLKVSRKVRILIKPQKTHLMTDGPSNRPTDTVTYRVACTRLKRKKNNPPTAACVEPMLFWIFSPLFPYSIELKYPPRVFPIMHLTRPSLMILASHPGFIHMYMYLVTTWGEITTFNNVNTPKTRLISSCSHWYRVVVWQITLQRLTLHGERNKYIHFHFPIDYQTYAAEQGRIHGKTSCMLLGRSSIPN